MYRRQEFGKAYSICCASLQCERKTLKPANLKAPSSVMQNPTSSCKPKEKSRRDEWMFHPIMKVKSTRALGNTTQAAAIKSQLGCLLRKQIAMIIPTCHPATALKHPSIKLPRNTLRPKQSSLFTSLSRTLTHTMPPPLPGSLHTFHSSWCVNCLQERKQRWLALWPTPRWQWCTRHTSFIVLRLG